MRTNVVSIILLFIVTALAATGCEVFDVREAEKPGSGGSPWQVPDIPARVFVNMRTGLEDRTGVNYGRSLDDAFTFVPLPEDLSNPALGGKFDNWTIDVENAVTDRLVAESF